MARGPLRASLLSEPARARGLRGASRAALATMPLLPQGWARRGGPAGCAPTAAFTAPAAAPRLLGKTLDLQSQVKEGCRVRAIKAGLAGGGAWSPGSPQPAAPPAPAGPRCRSTASRAPGARSLLSRRERPRARLLQRTSAGGARGGEV